MQQSLNDEFAEIDEAIAELEDRRTHVINQMSTTTVALSGEGNTIRIRQQTKSLPRNQNCPLRLIDHPVTAVF